MGRIYSLESVRKSGNRAYKARVEKKIRRLSLRGATEVDCYLLYEAIVGDRWNNGQAYDWYSKWISNIDRIISGLSVRKMSRIKYDNFLTCWGIREEYYRIIGAKCRPFVEGCGHGWFYDDRRAPAELKGLKTELAGILDILQPALTEDGMWGFRERDVGTAYIADFRFWSWESIYDRFIKWHGGRSNEISALINEHLSKKRKRFRNQSKIRIPGIDPGVAVMEKHWLYQSHFGEEAGEG